MSEVTEELNQGVNGAFAELVRDDLRSFSLVTTRDDGSITHTYFNGVEGAPSDLQTMTAYLLLSSAKSVGADPVEFAGACLVLARRQGLRPRSFEPVDEAVPSMQEQIEGER